MMSLSAAPRQLPPSPCPVPACAQEAGGASAVERVGTAGLAGAPSRSLSSAAAVAALAAAARSRRRQAGRVARRALAAGGFRRRLLGRSKLEVPEVCLGTMTWGQQNTEEEAHAQLDYAVKERGVNFLDTAEMYPVPTKAETQGRTDQYIGSWLKGSGVAREDLILATKVCGFSPRIGWVRDAGAPTRVTREQVRESVEKSLKRLGTDYVDLLQIHWPDRYVSIFGAGPYDESLQREGDVSFEEQLRAFEELQKEGLVRNFGVSNETSFGVMSFVRAAEELGLPRIISIQNSYSLLVRTGFETDLAETCCRRNADVGLLAYSPLAGGVLSGKYLSDDGFEGSRFTLFPGYMPRYRSSYSEAATREYVELARKHGLTPSQLALAWCRSRWFVASTIIGATSVEQLKENIDAFGVDLGEDVHEEVQAIFRKFRDPTINPAQKEAE